MDIFVEQMVKKKKEPKDYLVVLAGIVCVFLVLFVLAIASALPGIGFAVFAVCVISMYLIYFLVTSINKEYEYCFTNGLLDVDVIINKQKRKSMVEINVRKMELMGNRTSAEFEKYMTKAGVKKTYACIHKDAEDLCFIIFQDQDGKERMLLFNPNETMTDSIRRFNPQKVVL